jgi:hypothetical protein
MGSSSSPVYCIIGVGIVVGCAVLWDGLDRLFMGKPLEGLISTMVKRIHEYHTYPKLVKYAEDGYMINIVIAIGLFLPMFLAYCAHHALTHGYVDPYLLFLYHIIRIGPFFMNFAYVYTLCHKEGHSHTGLWAKGPWYLKPLEMFMNNIFNWWIGPMYGVFPSTFAYGHSRNHHKYNNSEEDIITTADRPRDSFQNWVAYVPRFLMYAVNGSSVVQFYKEGNWNVIFKMFLGSAYFCGVFMSVWYYISPHYAFLYLGYPLFENCILLSAVNWTWHAFIDPTNPENEYVNSITIFDGQINVLNEDYHVVHHQVDYFLSICGFELLKLIMSI